MAEVSGVSGASNPYKTGNYSAESNEKNTLTISSYFRLLAAQLAHQDYTNPMDNSEMLAQMSQMAMVQSLTSMTEAVDSQIAFAQQSYSVGMIGKEVTVVIEADESTGQAAKTKTGIIDSVQLTDDEPIVRLRGDTTDYKLSQIKSVKSGSDNQTTPTAP